MLYDIHRVFKGRYFHYGFLLFQDILGVSSECYLLLLSAVCSTVTLQFIFSLLGPPQTSRTIDVIWSSRYISIRNFFFSLRSLYFQNFRPDNVLRTLLFSFGYTIYFPLIFSSTLGSLKTIIKNDCQSRYNYSVNQNFKGFSAYKRYFLQNNFEFCAFENFQQMVPSSGTQISIKSQSQAHLQQTPILLLTAHEK